MKRAFPFPSPLSPKGGEGKKREEELERKQAGGALSADWLFFVIRHRRASADEVAIAVNVVDSADRREVLHRIVHLRVRTNRQLSRISPGRIRAENRVQRMRGVPQRIVFR